MGFQGQRSPDPTRRKQLPGQVREAWGQPRIPRSRSSGLQPPLGPHHPSAFLSPQTSFSGSPHPNPRIAHPDATLQHPAHPLHPHRSTHGATKHRGPSRNSIYPDNVIWPSPDLITDTAHLVTDTVHRLSGFMLHTAATLTSGARSPPHLGGHGTVAAGTHRGPEGGTKVPSWAPWVASPTCPALSWAPCTV